MDPTYALERIRAHVAALLEDNENMDTTDRCDLGESLATYIRCLDEWLSKGGFLPEAWDMGLKGSKR